LFARAGGVARAMSLRDKEIFMSGYKTDQRHLRHRGREFHFVSYEGQLADPRRGQVATPPTWFLMNGGKRWAAVPQIAGQEPDELTGVLTRWLDQHVFVATAEPSPAPPAPPRRGR
jgi:hypothetical protein